MKRRGVLELHHGALRLGPVGVGGREIQGVGGGNTGCVGRKHRVWVGRNTWGWGWRGELHVMMNRTELYIIVGIVAFLFLFYFLYFFTDRMFVCA